MKVAMIWAMLGMLCLASASFANEPYCREFTRDVMVAGKKQPGYGTACRQEDGDWKIVSEQAEPTEQELANTGVAPYSPVQYVVQREPVYVPSPPVMTHRQGWHWVDDSSFSTSIIIGNTHPWRGHGYRHRRGCRDNWHRWH